MICSKTGLVPLKLTTFSRIKMKQKLMGRFLSETFFSLSSEKGVLLLKTS